MSEHNIMKFHLCSKQVQKDSSPEVKSRPALCVRTTERCCCHQDVGRGGVLRGISKNMKVAAAQRVVVSLKGQQCSLVGDHLDGSFCSSMAAAGTHLPAHLPPKRRN